MPDPLMANYYTSIHQDRVVFNITLAQSLNVVKQFNRSFKQQI